ncbi:hypothetical protein G0Q06_01185 [Puniceicoccales bacterium CK1056]|uniref:Uncharacterized protein n=1 Tax=Oceanipulchritudo coccoides TaxID=2706888 RepID=A0A6B2LYA1_9BACT|nr:thrombospondin type 3 repeat-containing protein [Oceanipulchritudo coccoides]NDV61056.1 hypothetical protein [Oceanipulchritudo coccoides]
MKVSLQSTSLLACLGLVVPVLELPGQFINEDFVIKTPETLVAQPDLDGDGTPDIVVVDRKTGLIKPALFDGSVNWLKPVGGGIENVSALAAGNFEAVNPDSIALVSGPANRINVFSYTGDTLNLAPRPVFNDVFALSELVAMEEASSGNPATLELVGYSSLFDPSGPGIRDYITLDGTELISYGTPFDQPTLLERDYNHFLLEEGLPVMGFFMNEADPGVDAFTLAFLLDGSFDIIDQLPVPSGARVIHASFDGSGGFQFVFHVAGDANILCHAWTGSEFDLVGTFALNSPASQIFPFSDNGAGGLLARSMDGLSLTYYAFDGLSSPVEEQTFSPASGLEVNAAMTLPDGNMLLFSGTPGSNPNALAELFGLSGSTFLSLGDTGLPASNPSLGGSNVLLFSETPFINENASLTGQLGAGVWTSAVSVGTDVVVDAESFQGSLDGLGNPEVINLGSTPAGTVDALVNTIDSDISLNNPNPAIGLVPGTVLPVPDPGTYAESVTIDFVPSDPALDVFYRVLPDGSWINSTGPAGPFFESVSLQYYGLAGDGTRTPIRTAVYTISIPPSELDSDDDGVPDYVEIAAGIDPVNSGDDADGDGYSDLVELLAGSDPGDASSLPPSREIDTDGDGFSDLEEAVAGTDPNLPASFPTNPGVLNFLNVFDLLVVPSSHNGSGAPDPFVPSLDESLEVPGGDPLATTVRLYNADSSLLGFDRTALQGLGGVADPAAYIPEVVLGSSELLYVAATERNFNVDTAAPDQLIGRQIAGLIKKPASAFPPVPYSYGGAGEVLALEAAAWVSAAQSHVLSINRELVIKELDLFDTLALLLAELKIETVLRDRSIIGADPFTLTGFRSNEAAVELAASPGDGSRPVTVPASGLSALRNKAPGIDTGYRLDTICEVIEACVESDTDAGVLALREVAEEIYRISAATANNTPGSLVAPLDALRQFIRTGSLLNTGYLDDPELAPLDSATLASASAGVAYVLGKDASRPVEFRQLRIAAGGIQGSGGAECIILEDTASLESVSLIDFQGNSFPFPDAFELPEDTVIIVEGYADVTSDCLADVTLEVIPPIQLVSLPVAGTVDANDNLIPDDLEDLYAGVMNPFADSDNDGFSDLQESVEGTNPFDINSFPGGSPADLSPPVIAINESSPTQFTFSFEFPGIYADNFAFRLFSGPDLNTMSTDTGFDAPHLGGGTFQLTIAKPAEYPVFYRFKMLLD